MLKLLTALYISLTSIALIVLKLGSKNGAPIQMLEGKFHLNITPFAVMGFLFYGLSFLLYMYLISKFDLGYIIPLTTAFIYIIIFTASYLIFKESFSVIKIAGIALIIIGIVCLNIGK